MRIAAALTVLFFSMLAMPAAAAVFVCPTPQALPQTLGLQPNTPQAAVQLGKVQAYLANLKAISTAYGNVRTKAQRGIVASCLVYHVATLYDTNALQSPHTRADGATWFMLRQEVNASLALINPVFLRHNAHVSLARQWLSATPAYGAGSSYRVSFR